MYNSIVTSIGDGHVQQGSTDCDIDHLLSAPELERLEVLMLVDRSIAARIVRRCPSVLELSHGQMAARLILMKNLFRGVFINL